MKPVSRYRSGDNFWSRRDWPPSWQAHPDLGLVQQSLQANIAAAKASNERLRALLAHIHTTI